MEKKCTPPSGEKYAGKADRPAQKRRSLRQPAAPSAAPAEEAAKGERIAKKLARVGLASRREAEMMIAAGRVAVNGLVLAGPAVNVRGTDSITVDGRPLPVKERTRLWLYHKPAGLITTSRDPEGRTTVFETLPAALPRVLAVGRLDINTEGLLLLTNDGGLARLLELPATGWVRRYRVRVHGKTSRKQLDRLQEGLVVDGVFYSGAEAVLECEQGSNSWLSIAVREGKNHEIKNILGALGLTVTRLIRTSFGPFQLADLEPGAVCEVRGRILRDQLGARLAAEAQLDFSAPIAVVFPNAPVAARGERRRPEAAAAFAGNRERAGDKARPAPAAAFGRRAGKERRPYQAPEDEGWVSSGRRSPARDVPPRDKPQGRASRSANVWHGSGSRAPAGKIFAAAEKAPLESRHSLPRGRREDGQAWPRPAGVAEDKGRREGAPWSRKAAPRGRAGSRAFGERAAGQPGRADKETGDNRRNFADKRGFGRRAETGRFAAGATDNRGEAVAGLRRFGRRPAAPAAPAGAAPFGGKQAGPRPRPQQAAADRGRHEGKTYAGKAAGFAAGEKRKSFNKAPGKTGRAAKRGRYADNRR